MHLFLRQDENWKCSFKCKNFLTVEEHHSKCREKLLGEWKCLKYYSDQNLMVIKLKFTVAVQKNVIAAV